MRSHPFRNATKLWTFFTSVLNIFLSLSYNVLNFDNLIDSFSGSWIFRSFFSSTVEQFSVWEPRDVEFPGCVFKQTATLVGHLGARAMLDPREIQACNFLILFASLSSQTWTDANSQWLHLILW